jgi:hypothetical protein
VLYGMRAPSAILVAAIIAGLVIPALTRQWSDRSRELTLKQDLIERMDRSGADAIWAARTVARGGLPAIVLRNYACAQSESSQSCRQAERDAALAQAERINASQSSFRASATRIRDELQLYFPRTSVSTSNHATRPVGEFWADYADAVLTYSLLATDICGRNREVAYAHLTKEAARTSPPVGTGSQGNTRVVAQQPLCGSERIMQLDKSGLFVKSYAQIGDELLRAPSVFTSPIVNASTNGYSDTLSDFARDVGTPTIAFLALALIWTFALYAFRAFTYWPRPPDDTIRPAQVQDRTRS